MARIVAVCAVCKEKIGTNTCSLCGRLVCSKDFLPEKGVCVQCWLGKRLGR